MRLDVLTVYPSSIIFQSTHPLRDATYAFRSHYLLLIISIHAPLTGCDRTYDTLNYSLQYFNPRTPYGMRLCLVLIIPTIKIFQSTHPLRDATAQSVKQLAEIQFQSTHPLRDATFIPFVKEFFNEQFQSTHPLRDATAKKSKITT